jgi:antitoxin component HigA of HigAB toxin-antitoxin module
MARLKTRRAYRNLRDWMDATGTNQAELAKLAGIKPPHMSNILSKSRRCSLHLALKLSKLTNVPIEEIAAWPSEYEKSA